MAYRETAQVKAKKAATRASILRAAAQLVAAQGFSGVQMTRIADAADIAVGTLYKYFSAKETLFAEVFQIATEREVQAVEQALAAPGNAPQRLASALQIFARRALKNPTMAWALIAEPVDPAVDTERLIYRARYAQSFARVINQGITTGTLPPQSAAISSTALVGSIAESLVGPLAPKHSTARVDQADLISNIIQFCLQGLGVTDNTLRNLS